VIGYFASNEKYNLGTYELDARYSRLFPLQECRVCRIYCVIKRLSMIPTIFCGAVNHTTATHLMHCIFGKRDACKIQALPPAKVVILAENCCPANGESTILSL